MTKGIRTGATKVLIVPGLRNSEAAHWQSWMQHEIPGAERVEQTNWTDPDLDLWTSAIIRRIDAYEGAPVVLVAHSFGCLASYAAARLSRANFAGALFVAPADPSKLGIAEPIFDERLPFRSIVVGSENDIWMSAQRARHFSRCWGSQFMSLGCAGHINAASGFGRWMQGLRLLNSLIDPRGGLLESSAARSGPRPAIRTTASR